MIKKKSCFCTILRLLTPCSSLSNKVESRSTWAVKVVDIVPKLKTEKLVNKEQ